MKVRRRWVAFGLGALAVALIFGASPAGRWARSQMMGQRALLAFVKLIGAGNAQDVEAARSLCSAAYLARGAPVASPGGGMVGLPRNIHRNYQVWREGEDINVCPTDRVGPVYRMIREGGGWKFDGPVGLLRPGGRVEAAEIP